MAVKTLAATAGSTAICNRVFFAVTARHSLRHALLGKSHAVLEPASRNPFPEHCTRVRRKCCKCEHSRDSAATVPVVTWCNISFQCHCTGRGGSQCANAASRRGAARPAARTLACWVSTALFCLFSLLFVVGSLAHRPFTARNKREQRKHLERRAHPKSRRRQSAGSSTRATPCLQSPRTDWWRSARLQGPRTRKSQSAARASRHH